MVEKACALIFSTFYYVSRFALIGFSMQVFTFRLVAIRYKVSRSVEAFNIQIIFNIKKSLKIKFCHSVCNQVTHTRTISIAND